ncbi:MULTISPECIES: hypothetical protein [Marinobacter]|uniref:hypothetical protein n=1 Tax=Marinobacter TaxID=2742 RepID=UPI001B056C99|nr:hypothetical protein [Marinobacter sp.]MBO6812123.1 hypothetical protein [Marinobacter sp.]MBO6873629.1 hypothetical protein [Marinobacter sp.]
MHKFFLLLGLSVVLTTGFQNKASAESNELVRVNIEFLSALIGPTKVNGNPWDSKAKINSTAMGMISDMIAPGSGVAASTVAAAVAKNAPQGISAPDVIGYVVQRGPTIRNLVNIAGIPMALASNRTKTRDSYTPRFYADYQNWPMFPGTRFQVQLWDMDLADNDQIAVVEITYDEIMRARDEGEPTWINVADQSMNQLLYVLISVSPSIGNTPPKMNGYRWN